MSEQEPSFEQACFVSELDDVADVLRTTHHPRHVGHQDWGLRSTGALVCGCGAPLYAPEVARAMELDPNAADFRTTHTRAAQPDGREQLTVHAPREIDIATADTFSRDLDRAFAAAPEQVVIDFAGTTFCDSTALRLLVTSTRQAHASGCRLQLLHPPRQLLVIAEVLGASGLLGLEASGLQA